MPISTEKNAGISRQRDLAPVGGASVLGDRILLIEDNEEDVMQFQRLVRRTGGTMGVDVVTDGETAVRWLAERMAESHVHTATLPRTIFLDLRLPGMAGAEVLRWIRAQPELDGVALVVCSSFAGPREASAAVRLGADTCVAKFPAAGDFAALLTRCGRRSSRRCDETPGDASRR